MEFDLVLRASGLLERFRRDTATWPDAQRALAALRSAYVAAVGDVTYTAHLMREEASSDTTGLLLGTIHSAKGTEFEAVFVCGLNGDYLPYWRSLEEDPVGGELRELMVLYVALTRAKRRLYLVGSRHGQGRRRGHTSRFLRYIERDAVRLAA